MTDEQTPESVSEVAVKKKPRTGGRKAILIPVEVAADLVELEGNFAAIARRHGVSRTAVQKLVAKYPALQRIVSDARESILDDTEHALHAAIKRGEAWAICFKLKCHGKARGYTERDNGHVDPASQKPMVVGGDAKPDALK